MKRLLSFCILLFVLVLTLSVIDVPDVTRAPSKRWEQSKLMEWLIRSKSLYSVSAATTITVSIDQLSNFLYTVGGPPPASQSLHLSSAEGQPYDFMVASN